MPKAPRVFRPPRVRTRPDATRRGYGYAWKKLRAEVLAAEPDCRLCAERGIRASAIVVDHITPRRRFIVKAEADRRENLQPLCDACHRSKTRGGE